MRRVHELRPFLLLGLLAGALPPDSAAFPQDHARARAVRVVRSEQDPKLEHEKSARAGRAQGGKKASEAKTASEETGAAVGKPEKRGGGGAVVLRGEVFAAAEATPLGEVEIALVLRHHGKHEEVIARTSSEKDGSFVCEAKRQGALARARAGKHAERMFVRAIAPGWLPAEKRCSLTDGDWKARVELAPGILVQGRVVDSFGNPLTSVTVQIDGLRASEPAGDPARWAIPWQVDHARSMTTGFALGVSLRGTTRSSRATQAERASGSTVLPEARYLRLPDVVLASQASLTGVLATSSGVPLPGVMIRAELVREQAPVTIPLPVLAPAGLVSAHATTDRRGRFAIDGLLPGSYSLVADCNVGSVRRAGEDSVPGLHEMTHLAEAPLARQGDAPGTTYVADGTDLPLVLDACLLDIELQAKGHASSKALWV
jgi:hypothetical protein